MNKELIILVIIPTYNEKDNLSLLIESLFSLPEKLSVLVVDDNSPDGTGKIADDLQKKYTKLHVLHREQKEGLGKAYLHGYAYALEHFEWDGVIQMDADFSHDPRDIPRIVERLQTYDVVIGSRHMRGSQLHYPLTRKLLSFCANWYARILLGLKVQDATAGFRGYRRNVIEKFQEEKFFSSDYAFQTEMLFYAQKNHFKIIEIPVIFKDREKGKSKMTFHNMFEGVLGIIKVRLENMKRKEA